ncbi:hypothetical protein OXX79_014147, partial [Metschnikowia pulcherrima]
GVGGDEHVSTGVDRVDVGDCVEDRGGAAVLEGVFFHCHQCLLLVSSDVGGHVFVQETGTEVRQAKWHCLVQFIDGPRARAGYPGCFR